jgi:large subunit ribosomal protein L22
MANKYTSTQKFLRMSPKKIRVVVTAIKGMTPQMAVEVLPYVGKRAAEPLMKTIKSAIANANMQGAKAESLIFSEIQIGEGPRLKRGMAAPKGRYHPIMKKMAHIRVVLTTKEVSEKETKQMKSREKTVKNEAPKMKQKGGPRSKKS